MKHILITGIPGIGKTTLIKKLIKRLTDSQIELDGFFTEEIRNERFQRIGFNVRLIKSNASTTLADKISLPFTTNTRKLGQYTVYVKNFEDFSLEPLMTFEKGILIIDEIGKMELCSKKFEDAVSTIISKKHIRILATVPVKSSPPFIERLKRDNRCQIITVTMENRDHLLEEILNLLLNHK